MVAAQSETYSDATTPAPRSQRVFLGTLTLMVLVAFLQDVVLILIDHITRAGPVQTALFSNRAFISPAPNLSKVKQMHRAGIEQTLPGS